MNIKALKAFRLIVINGSLATAAKSLHLSQPAVSRLISLLEHEAKLQLFYRTRRRLTLTPEGEAFYRQAEHLLAGFDELPRIIEDIKAKTGGNFRLVTAQRAGTRLACARLDAEGYARRSLHRRYPVALRSRKSHWHAALRPRHRLIAGVAFAD